MSKSQLKKIRKKEEWEAKKQEKKEKEKAKKKKPRDRYSHLRKLMESTKI